tara:strand:+ start:1091 stop:1516 length:426 start_codon:yes stop_codon:yes gene_type:complete
MTELNHDRRTLLNTLWGIVLGSGVIAAAVDVSTKREPITTSLYIGTNETEPSLHLSISERHYRRFSNPEETLDYVANAIRTADSSNYEERNLDYRARVRDFIDRNIQYRQSSEIQSPLVTLFERAGDEDDLELLATTLLSR